MQLWYFEQPDSPQPKFENLVSVSTKRLV